MNEETNEKVTVSVVSHGHGAMVADLLEDLSRCPEISRVVITHNIPEPPLRLPAGLAPEVVIIENIRPKGFSANHNAAFGHCRTPFYAVVNPDIRFTGNPVERLLDSMHDDRAALCAPAVLNPSGNMEDSARKFPTPFGIISKALGLSDGRYRFGLDSEDLDVDWVAGMFMLFRTEDYARARGFDEGFFLYYEDVDICARLRNTGRAIRVCPGAIVTHDARRASRTSLKHLRWHLRSMARYFTKRLLSY